MGLVYGSTHDSHAGTCAGTCCCPLALHAAAPLRINGRLLHHWVIAKWQQRHRQFQPLRLVVVISVGLVHEMQHRLLAGQLA